MQIVVKPLFIHMMDELFIALLEKNYFSDMENAKAYRSRLEEFVQSLSEHKHRLTNNDRWGRYYAAYKANRHTTWFVTFDKFENDGYIVRNIFNNHTEEYPRFITG